MAGPGVAGFPCSQRIAHEADRVSSIVAPKAERSHWQRVWQERTEDDVSWFQSIPHESLRMIRATGVPSTARVVDVGAGASRLVDLLLEHGWSDLAVVDIAEDALVRARERLGAEAKRVQWTVADVRDGDLGGPFDVWHDRAVFHFLTDAQDRAAYVRNMTRHLAAKGHVVIATFAPDGPEKCSGLPVAGHDGASLARELGDGYRLAEEKRELHKTPGGSVQPFVYARFWKRGDEGEAHLLD